MANEITLTNPVPGATDFYVIIRDSTALTVWNGSAFVPWVDGDIATYDIAMVDQGGDLYTATPPATLPDGDYTLFFYNQIGGTPAITDVLVHTKLFSWLAATVVTPGTGSLSGPTSEVDICNLALLHLKEKPIATIDPPISNTERLCSILYHQRRRALLRSHPWNFAIRRVTLTADSGVPLSEFERQYTFPSDFLRFIKRVDDEGVSIDGDDYSIEQGKYLVDGEVTQAINVVYIRDEMTISLFDPLFIDLFALDLAIHLAPNFSGSEDRVRVLAALQQQVRAEARAIDGQERPPKVRYRSKWIAARSHGTDTSSKYITFS